MFQVLRGRAIALTGVMTKTSWLSGLAALLAGYLGACGFETRADDSGDGVTPPPPTVDAIAIARATIGGAVHIVLVFGDNGESIDGADLGAFDGSIMERIARQGTDGILADAMAAPPIRVGYDVLLPPVEVSAASVDVVENYPDPKNQSDAPFMFPNVAKPTPAIGSVPASAAELLDYQVELCVVLGQEAPTAAAFATAPKGWFLCEHMIDRGTQLRNGDDDHPERAKGYPEATSRRGYWRTGPYLYVPRDASPYLAAATLHLEVNGDVRQSSAVAAMRWPIDEIAKRTLAIGADARWSFNGTPIRLIPGATLPAGLVLVTGSPAGSAFDPPDDEFVERAHRDYILGGGYLSGMSMDEFTTNRVLARERTNQRYLHAGDVLEASATYLGRLRVTID